jgi:hypothetical protein
MGDYEYYRSRNEMDRHVSQAGLALVLRLISIPLAFFMNLGVIIGGVAIVIAILSKGVAEKLLPQARKAIIYGLLGVVIGYGVFAYDVYKVMNDPATRQQLNVMSEQMNGISFDDMLRELGIDPGTP